MKKHIFITGSTDGIGKLAAIQLAKEEHHIYIHGRKQEKLDKVVEEIKSLTGNEQVKGYRADFSDLNDVRSLAEQMKSDIPQLDVLVNNAGVFKSPIATNKDGLDLRMVVNYLAPFVLTNAVLPIIQKGQSPRIINLSSAAQAPVSHAVLSGQTHISEQAAYAQSKLAITMWSNHLAKRQEDIVVIPVNPGSLLNTNMVKEGYGYHWSSADKGANIIHDLAVGKEHAGMSGQYFDNDQENYGRAHADAYHQNKIQRLISDTEEILSQV